MTSKIKREKRNKNGNKKKQTKTSSAIFRNFRQMRNVSIHAGTRLSDDIESVGCTSPSKGKLF